MRFFILNGFLSNFFMDYTQIQITNITQAESEIFIAQLSEIGFYGFEEEEGQLHAFIHIAQFDEILLKNVLNNTSYTKSTIAKQNWNALWESSFEPIEVYYPNSIKPFVHVRAHFHEAKQGFEHSVIITPKMSFGTGHHATTYLMMEQMSQINFEEKIVIDFGTGTGILAILAKKMGANTLYGVDNDEWSITNAIENAQVNNSADIQFLLNNKLAIYKQADVMLANINLNIISANINEILAATAEGGIILFSGIMAHDEQNIVDIIKNKNIKLLNIFRKNNWLALKCEKLVT